MGTYAQSPLGVKRLQMQVPDVVYPILCKCQARILSCAGNQNKYTCIQPT